MAAWYKKNKRKVAASQAAWHKKNSAKVNARHREWHKRNRRRVAARGALWRKKNRVQNAARHAVYHRKNRRRIAAYRKKHNRKAATQRVKAAWRKKNKLKIAKRHAAYWKENKVRLAAQHLAYCKRNKQELLAWNAAWRRTKEGRLAMSRHRAKRRALKYAAPYIAHVTPAPIDGRCPCCRTKMVRGSKTRAPTLDHIVALNRGGHHVPGNTWIICQRCNSAKNDKPLSHLLDRLKLSKSARRRVLRIACQAVSNHTAEHFSRKSKGSRA